MDQRGARSSELPPICAETAESLQLGLITGAIRGNEHISGVIIGIRHLKQIACYYCHMRSDHNYALVLYRRR